MTGSQETAAAPQKTAIAPQKTAVAPRKAGALPQKTAVALDASSGMPASPMPGKMLGSGAEADISIVDRGGTQYALKVYHHDFHPNAAVADALRHLGGKGFVADIYETGMTPDGREYELMEYLPAGSLARYDLRGNAAVITTVLLRVAMALNACHRSKVIHKDIKPANILVKDTSAWDCVLCDFGIADVMNSDGKSITKQSRTPIYAAPEIYDPARAKARIDGEDLFEIGPAADFYSLGMTVLCLWSGEDAFLAAEEKMAVAKLDRGVDPPRDMPERLRRIVSGLLAKNPSERWDLKDIEDSLGGHWAVMHTLNPLSDVRLNPNPESKDYAMTGQSIGAFLNKVYMWQFDDAAAPADAKLCQAVVDSFSRYDGSYMQSFFASKGDRFTQQDSWMRYCCDWESGDNAKKAGPTDDDTRLEISMMKTIKGFGFTPYFGFKDDTVTSLEELEGIDRYDRKYGLSHGLKGWLAVQYHENPDADLAAGGYAYEDLLDAYILKIGEIDPKAEEYCAYSYACDKAEELYDDILKTMRKNRKRTTIQTVLGILFILIPQAAIVVRALRSLSAEPRFRYLLALVPAAVLLVSYLVKVLLKGYRYVVTYTSGGQNTDRMASDIIKGKAPDIGYEELVVEPLYYAFSDEEDFDSSLNGIVDNHICREWGDYVKDRSKKTVKHIILSLAIVSLAYCIMPSSVHSAGKDEQEQTDNKTAFYEQVHQMR